MPAARPCETAALAWVREGLAEFVRPRSASACAGLGVVKYSLDVAGAVQDAHDFDASASLAIEQDIIADRQAAESRRQLGTRTPYAGRIGQQAHLVA